MKVTTGLRALLGRLIGGSGGGGSTTAADDSSGASPSYSPDRWRRVTELLTRALEVPTAERASFLEAECEGDERLRSEVMSLLEAHEGPGPLDELADLVPALDAWAAPAATEGEELGPYRILERLGRGGMGVVYRARDDRLGRTVAIKLLPPHRASDDEARRRFLREARAVSSLDHPGLCTIYDIGQSERGRPFIAMACYDGETLKEKIARGPLPIDRAVDWTAQIAGGLAAAHDAGVLHRDLKPSNVMVTEGGTVKVLDFGLAKVADLSLTDTGARMGTPYYMSPEQALGEELDPRTDVWSLGVMLYEMLTGERPFDGEAERAVLEAIRNRTPRPLGALREGVPERLAGLVERALEKRPADRPSTMEELAEELDRIRSGEASRKSPRTPPPGRSPAASSGEVLPEGERRQVTLLVARLDGFEDLVERMVPEDVERTMRRIRKEATEVVERHEGVVNRFFEDELVVAFGVPSTREDDVVRAARAALELHGRVRALSREVGEHADRAFRLRSGIDTGLVVAQRPEGGDRPYRFAGSALRTAGRLAGRAGPDEILAGSESRRLLSSSFETEARDPIRAERDGRPVTPHRVVGEAGSGARVEATERASLTAYTGRDEELATLERCVERALAGEGRLLTVEGDAGLGKSRLLHELERGLEDEDVRVLRGSCPSYGGSVSYLPFIEVLKDVLGLRGADPGSIQPERVADRVREVDRELEDFIPFYLHLLSIPSERYPLPKHLEGEHFRLAMIEALTAMVTLTAGWKPVVTLLEDWHWADRASGEVLRQLAEMVDTLPLLVVVTYRPGHDLDWGHPARHTPMRLGPLDASSSICVMKSVAGVDVFPEDLGRLVHERTGGNPFFLEEVCRTLFEEETLQVEDGEAVLEGSLESLRLPSTVQAVLRARMDRMDPAARDVLRAASVVGRAFTRELLARTLPDDAELLGPMETLRSLGVVRQTRVLPEATYRFKHVLTRDVAYESLLHHQRKRLHGRVGRAIEELHEGRLDEHLDLLTHHFRRAEAWEKAVRYGRSAARKAHRLSRFPEALRRLDDVRGWLSELPEGPDRQETLVEILLQVERLCETLGLRGRQQEIIDELIAILDAEEDRARLAEVHLRQGDLRTLLRQFGEAEASLRKALGISRELADAVVERNVLRSLGLLRWHEGRSEEALEHIEAALAIDREREDVEAIVGDLCNLGNVLRGMGEHERARDHLLRALELSERLPTGPTGGGVLVKQAYILHILGTVHRALGEVDEAIAYLERAIEQGAERRLPIQRSYHYTSLAHVHLRQGDLEESLRLYREAVRLSRRSRHATGLSQSLRILGEVLHGLGRHEEALPHLEEAAELFARLEDHDAEALMWSRIAASHEAMDDYPDAVAAWSRARRIREREDDGPGELEALEGIARVTRRHVDEPSLALDYYGEALARARELGDASAEGRLRNTMGILEWHRGEFEAALAHYERALDLFREVDDRAHEGLILNSLGVTLVELERREEAASRLQEAVELNRRAGQRLLEGHGLAALGELRLEAGEVERAQGLFDRSLELRRAVEDREGEGWMLYRLGRTYAAQGQLSRAREHATRALDVADECGLDDLRQACRRLRTR